MGLLENYVALSPEVKETIGSLRKIIHDVHRLNFFVTDVRDKPWSKVFIDAIGRIPKNRFDAMEESFESEMDLFTKTYHHYLGKLIQANYVLSKGQLVVEITYSLHPKKHIDLDHYIATGEVISKKLLDP